MFESIAATVIAAAITGAAGYGLKWLLSPGRYLPGAISRGERSAYGFIDGEWFLHHLTRDPKQSTGPVVTVSRMALSIDGHLIVKGVDAVLAAGHRRPLHYQVRGEVRAGQLFLTGLCTEDPSDYYTCVFPNLLDDEAGGVLVARDYLRALYASPALLARKRMSEREVLERLPSTPVSFLAPSDISPPGDRHRSTSDAPARSV